MTQIFYTITSWKHSVRFWYVHNVISVVSVEWTLLKTVEYEVLYIPNRVHMQSPRGLW